MRTFRKNTKKIYISKKLTSFPILDENNDETGEIANVYENPTALNLNIRPILDKTEREIFGEYADEILKISYTLFDSQKYKIVNFSVVWLGVIPNGILNTGNPKTPMNNNFLVIKTLNFGNQNVAYIKNVNGGIPEFKFAPDNISIVANSDGELSIKLSEEAENSLEIKNDGIFAKYNEKFNLEWQNWSPKIVTANGVPTFLEEYKSAKYFVIDDTVWISMNFRGILAEKTTGSVFIEGLPFAMAKSESNFLDIVGGCFGSAISINPTNSGAVFRILPSSKTLQILGMQYASTGLNTLDGVLNISFQGFYRKENEN